MLAELGLPTTILIAIALGLFGSIFLMFWIQLFAKYFDASKYLLPLVGISIVVWFVALCVVPGDWINDNARTWGYAFFIYYIGTPAVMFIMRLLGK